MAMTVRRNRLVVASDCTGLRDDGLARRLAASRA